jgi:radical SAM protein with 4Fe4S-binding SPASM domain
VINPRDYPNIKMSNCAANGLNMPLTLDIEGNMRLCNHSPNLIGNIFTHSLVDMLHSHYVSQWSKVIPDYCVKCALYPRCRGGCRAASEQLGLSLQQVDPIVNFA